MRVRDDLLPRNRPPLTGDSAIAGSLNEKCGPLRMKEGAVHFALNGDTGGIAQRNSLSPFEMTEKRIFSFRLPHQRETDQGRERVVDDVRDDRENRKAEPDERQPLFRFRCISL